MSFAQLTFRESLRDIEACLRSVPEKLYHLGFRGYIARSTLADANETRDWRIYADFAQSLIHIARPMYASDPLGVDLDATVYALDSTTIDHCLSVFPWAHFRHQKAAVKMHTVLDLRGSIPLSLRFPMETIMTYTCWRRSSRNPERSMSWTAPILTSNGAFFVTRTKTGVVLSRRYSHAVPPGTGVSSDQTVVLGTPGSARNYPDTLRRVRFVDPEQARSLIFLTNNFELPALAIAQLYKSRWRIGSNSTCASRRFMASAKMRSRPSYGLPWLLTY